MSWNPIVQLTLNRLREFLREPEALFWVFVFPVLLTIGLGIAFRSQPEARIPVGVEDGPRAERALAALAADPGLDARRLDPAAARQELRTGRVALVVLPADAAADEAAGTDGWVYWFDPTRSESATARLRVDAALQAAAGRSDVFRPGVRAMTEKGSRYIDFLVPGLLGMNLMSTGMFGIGFSIVTARSRGLLKRLVATPMKKSHYILAQIGGRLVFLIAEVAVLVAFAHWAFDVPVRGSLVELALLSLISAALFAGMGLLVASRASTIEGISGLMNLVMLPMWLMSGIFFSTSRFPDLVQPFVQALPLTAVNDALRALMLEGVSLWQIPGEVGIVVGWCVACYLGALVLFRWF